MSEELDPTEVHERARAEGWQLVDVREAHELAMTGRFPGARHVPLGELTGEAESIARDRPVVFTCRTGSRSGMAADAFRASGWDAYNLRGGIEAWEAAGLPLERESDPRAGGQPGA